MKKRLLAILLVVCMLVALVPAALADYGPYTDIDADDWYADEVLYAYNKGLMNGVGDDRFNPAGTVSRAMVWTTLARLDGVDTTGSEPWWLAGQKWAMEKGISDGTNATANVTREQLVTMLYRYAEYKTYDVSVGEDTNILSYTDAFSVSEWAIEAFQWACGAGVINGVDGKLLPQKGATRAQFAVMLYRFCENTVGNYKPTIGEPCKYTWTPNGDGTHTGYCSCGKTTTGKCILNKDKVCILCGASYASTAADLQAALTRGGYIALTDDVELDEPLEIPEGVTVTIDLAGNDISTEQDAQTGRSPYAIENNGKATIKGSGSIFARGIMNYGDMTIEDGVKITASDDNGGAAVWNEGDLVINGGEFDTVDQDGVAPDATALTNNGGTVEINDGKFDGETPRAYAVINQGGGKMTINGGEFTGKHGVIANDDGTVEIIDGTFSLVGVAGQSDHTIYSSSGKVTVKGGLIKRNGNNLNGDSIMCEDGGEIEATGGTFDADPSDKVASGCKAEDNGDGTWTVKQYFTESDGAGTETEPFEVASAEKLDAMFSLLSDRADDAETVYIELTDDIDLADVEWDNGGEVLNGFVLDGNGKTIKNISSITSKRQTVFQGLEDAKISNITFDFAVDDATGACGLVYNCYGETTFENVTVTGEITTSGNWASAFVAYPYDSADGTLVFKNCVNRADLTTNTTSSSYAAPFGSHTMSIKKVVFENCANYGKITGGHAAGIVGMTGGNTSRYELVGENAAVNYGVINYSIAGGHFKPEDTTGIFKEKTTKGEGASLVKMEELAVTLGEIGSKLVLPNVANAAKYTVNVSISQQIYNYDDGGNANKWSGAFPWSVTKEYTATGSEITTDFIIGYVGEANIQRKNWQTGENADYVGIYVPAGFSLDDATIILGDPDAYGVLLVEYGGKTFYYMNMGAYYGTLTAKQAAGTEPVNVTFGITVTDANGTIIGVKSVSYSFAVTDARTYLGGNS